MFYRVVTWVVLTFGLDNWVLLTAMDRMVEGTHTGFLRQIMGNQARRKSDRTWLTPKAEVVWEAARTQSEMTYIRIIQGMVEKQVAMRTIFEVCTS